MDEAAFGAGHSILGVSVRRTEDPELLVGTARYVPDLDAADALHLCLVRSTAAHARIRSVEADAAAALPGVALVVTADDLALDPAIAPFLTTMIPEPYWRPYLATGVVRFVGEAVVAVLAETPTAAVDAAELVEIDLEPLPSVVDPEEAMVAGAPLLFPDAGTNVALSIPLEAGPEPTGETVTVEARLVNQRIAASPIEVDGVLARPDADGAGVTLWASTQTPHGLRDLVAQSLALDPDRVRVVAPWVGGGFGAKGAWAPEYVLVAALALKTGRPVRYVQTRSENLLLSTARGQVQHVKLTATPEGDLLALDVHVIVDGGAYPGIGAFLPMMTRSMAPGVYAIPRVSYRIDGVATNTAPNGGFRGAGRPEATALIERTMDLLAAELGIDPVTLRRRNLIPPAAFPYTTPVGSSYDSGDYDAAITSLLDHAGYDALRAEQVARRDDGGPLLGIGVSAYVEVTAAGGGPEFGSVEVRPDGSVLVTCGTSAHGQGHATSYAQIVAETLGVDFDRITLLEGDTATTPYGGGTQGSRSVQIGGSAVLLASREVLDKARRVAAHLLEASPDDIVGFDGGLGVAGVPATALAWADLAAAAADADRLPPGMEPGLAGAPGFVQAGSTYPFGAHLAVVEVDRETGKVTLVRMVAVDDCGTIVNPLLAAGQVHGGVASGIGQALFEESVFDADGNPQSITYADYGLPSAADLPMFEVHHTVTPTPMNPLGAKGIGESGTIGSVPAVQNAVVDALAHLGVRHVDLPCTAERVWRAMQEASAG